MTKIIYPVKSAHTKTADEICDDLHCDIAKGLTEEEAGKRLKFFGKNTIEEKRKQSPLIVFLRQFKGPFVILLFAAAGLSFYFREWLDGNAILFVILLNGIIGFIMEYQAERSMEALKRLTQVNGKVIRNGKLIEISSEEIVPGDILFAEAGDMILADARIVQLSQLQLDESTLTGESVPVDKQKDSLDEKTPLAERINMLYKGTFVAKGNVRVIVTATGMKTEFGKIAGLVQSAAETITPLEKRIAKFSKKIIWLAAILILPITVAGFLYDKGIYEIFRISIVMAVAAIPEGLPIVTTLALARGILKMSKKKVIVKRLEAVETLGSANVICADKTGTLTENKIEIKKIVTPDKESKSTKNEIKKSKEFQPIDLIKKISVLCNTAELIQKDKKIKETGDPLEIALLKFAFSEGLEIESFREEYEKIKEEPFSSETKMMATLHQSNGKYFLAAKGASEELLKHCTHFFKNGKIHPFEKSEKKYWMEETEKLAESGLRVIAAGFREPEKIPQNLSEKLVFAGLIGMLDPPRKEVFSAIKECKSAGIKVVMITGDHPSTAKNIGLQLGITEDEKEPVILGKDMSDYEDLSSAEKKKWLEAKIFARVSPKQKLDLVKVLQEKKSVVAMTGDGVNDAPALKKADIGIAMGIRGTQVAQEVADMILKDDSFSSIAHAIKQGRIIFENIRKFVVYLLSCNLSELVIVSATSIINLPFGLLPLQILYINLLTDVFPALALGMTEGSRHIMKHPPKNMNEQIVDKPRWISIVVYSSVMASCCLGAVLFSHYIIHKNVVWATKQSNNILFITLILSQLWNSFNMTSDHSISFFKSNILKNKFVWYALAFCAALTVSAYYIEPVAKVLHLFKPGIEDSGVILIFSLLSLGIIQMLKRRKIIL